jgi:hypothetical protein
MRLIRYFICVMPGNRFPKVYPILIIKFFSLGVGALGCVRYPLAHLPHARPRATASLSTAFNYSVQPTLCSRITELLRACLPTTQTSFSDCYRILT